MGYVEGLFWYIDPIKGKLHDIDGLTLQSLFMVCSKFGLCLCRNERSVTTGNNCTDYEGPKTNM